MLKMKTFFSACWGKENSKAHHKWIMETAKKCQQQEPPFDESELFRHNEALARLHDCSSGGHMHKRAADEHDSEEMEMFMHSLKGLREAKVQTLGNITCVMRTTGMWNDDLTPNTEYYQKTMWDLMAEHGKEQPEDFKEEMKMYYKMCEGVANAIPPLPEDAAPFKKRFGKGVLFHKCTLKVETDLCSKKLVADWLQEKHGEFTKEKAAALGLPENKYEAAYIHSKAMKFGMEKSMWLTKNFLFKGKLY